MQVGLNSEIQRSQQKSFHRHTDSGVIAEVQDNSDSYCVTTTCGTGFGGINKPVRIVPQVGQTITFYLYQGSRVQGIDLDGKELFFKTQQELEVERQEEADKMKSKKIKEKEEFYSELANPNSEFNKRLSQLPKVFKQRFQKFFRLGDNFWAHAWYELVACETSLKIAYACKSWQKISLFHKMSWNEQKLMIPTMDNGLSGNQFGFACFAARVYLRDPKNVCRIHGSMSPLTGSKPYIGK
jgi:hypothetical protein